MAPERYAAARSGPLLPRLCASLVAILVAPSLARADPQPPPSAEAAASPVDAPRAFGSIPETVPVLLPATLRITSTASRALPADLDGDRGTLSLWRGLVELEGTIPTSSGFTWKWGLQVEVDQYDFSQVDRVVPGAGRFLEEGLLLRAGPGIEWKLGDTWSTAVGIHAQSAVVRDVRLADTLTFGAVGTVRVRAMPRLGVRVGASVGTELDGGSFLNPIVGIDAGDPTGLEGPVRFTVRGSGLRLGYAFTETFGAGVSVRYDRRDWRLAPDDRVSAGLVSDRRYQAGIDVEWTMRRALALSFEVGLDFHHEVRVEDRGGNLVTAFQSGRSVELALSVTWTF